MGSSQNQTQDTNNYLRWITCNTIQGRYSGFIRNRDSRPERFGEILYSNNDNYKGQWKNGLRHGYGYFSFDSYSEHFGWWQNGIMTGPGIQRSKNNRDIYAGWFHENLRNGRGVYIKEESFIVYDGQWKKNNRNGEAKVYKNGSWVYYGMFEDNVCVGHGVKRKNSGNIDVSYYIGGTAFGDGIEWGTDMQSAYQLDSGQIQQYISVEEAHRISAEQDLPVPSASFVTDIHDNHTAHLRIFELIQNLDQDPIKGINDLSIIKDVVEEVFEILNLGPVNSYPLILTSLEQSSSSQEDKKSPESGSSSNIAPPLVVELNIKKKKSKDSSSVSGMSSVESSYNSESVKTIYEGDFTNEAREGPGTIWRSNGDAECHFFEDGEPKGEGVIWNSDRTKSWISVDGVRQNEISLGEAVSRALSLGLFVPEISGP